MKRNTGKVFGKLVTAAMAAAFVFMSASTAKAAETTSTQQASIEDLQSIIDGEAESEPVGTPVVLEDGTVMYHTVDLGKKLNLVYEEEKSIVSPQAENTYYRIQWTVEPDTRYVSYEYEIKKGQYVCANINVIPGDKNFKFGLMNDDGDAWYVDGLGTAYYNFPVPATNLYRVYVQNDYKKTTLYADGGFSYSTKRN